MGCAPCIVILDLRQSGPAVSNDHHRARSMVHAMLTDRAKKRLGKTAVAAAADDQQVSSISSIQQHPGRIPLLDYRPDADRAVRAYDSADAVSQRGFRKPGKVRLFEGGERPVRHAAYHDRLMPSSDCVDRPSSQLSLPQRPGQGLPRCLRAVYAYDDAVTVA